MKYKISVEEFQENDGESYDKYVTIYEQKIDKINLQSIIKAVNEEQKE